MNVSGILQSNLSCDLEKNYSFVGKWETYHDPEDICLFQLPSNLRTGCAANDDGFANYIKSAPLNATYMSPTIQNEIIHIMATDIKEKIKSMINEYQNIRCTYRMFMCFYFACCKFESVV